MIKEKMLLIRDFVVKYSKFVFPVIIVLTVAVTVFFMLRIKNGEIPQELAQVTGENIIPGSEDAVSEETSEIPPEEVVLVEDTNGELYTLVATYYNAYANGDVETIKEITSYLDETDEIKIPKMSEYVESYPTIKIYSKTGPIENSWLAYVYFQMTMSGFEDVISGMETFYVCTDANGKLFMNTSNVSKEELEYIRVVSSQDDVAELYNRVNVECKEVLMNNEDLHSYIQEAVNDVQKTTGEILAILNASNSVDEEAAGEGSDNPGTGTGTTEETAQSGPVYATATTTVNVRKSDSEIAEKVGKIAGGTKVQVLEQKVNGWSKVIAEGKEGYIKSEYLQMAETVTGEVIGTITAKTTVNVRMSPNQNSEKLGVLAGGDSAPLLDRVDDWCKINYNGSAGYVKAEFVE